MLKYNMKENKSICLKYFIYYICVVTLFKKQEYGYQNWK